MGVKKCELCDSPARIHCESDQANLCWDCDAKVHGANFLVARHSRCLLCRRCQSPTPWRAEGSRLGGTVSVCQLCAATASGSLEGNGEGGCPTKLCVEEEKRVEEVGGRDRDEEKEDGEGEEGEEEEEEEDEESENGEEEDDIDEGENQVVPWSMTPPPVASSSSSDYEEDETGRTAGNTGVHLKRMRENVGLTVSQVNLILCLLLLLIDFSSRELLIITNLTLSILSSKRKLVPVSDSRNVLIQSQDDLACSSSRLASDPAESAVAPDEINSLATPFRSLRDRKRPAHALASPAPPVADSTTATMRNFRVHNANHRQGVGVFHAPNLMQIESLILKVELETLTEPLFLTRYIPCRVTNEMRPSSNGFRTNLIANGAFIIEAT
ncbi:hypothetical protein ZIOFF_021667 [Zingiber officinale]|uniref:B box-type domain-containing protein n=1 Tax=Zingiber officinale TaxID=94328 RepID=A0A8J5H1S4_ZINOF|nr:hypothetical protein ZIOFF_021667 [Zingiber officinale]